MSAGGAITSLSGQIPLWFVELCQFRRLGKVQLEIDTKTTILVGANNCGTASTLAALRHSLADGSSFGGFRHQFFSMAKIAGTWNSLGRIRRRTVYVWRIRG